MTTTINGRTPEEIKRGLKKCTNADCSLCLSSFHCDLEADALAYIQQLERERDEARNDLDTINYANTELHSAYEAMKREREAAVKDIARTCLKCAHRERRFLADGKLDDLCGTCIYNNMCNWQWRGVQEVQHGTE